MREVLHSANIFFPDDSIYFPQVTDPFKAIFFSSVSIFIARNGKNSRLPLKRNFFQTNGVEFPPGVNEAAAAAMEAGLCWRLKTRIFLAANSPAF